MDNHFYNITTQAVSYNYNYPLNSEEVGMPTLQAVKNPPITYSQPSIYTVPLYPVPHLQIQPILGCVVL